MILRCAISAILLLQLTACTSAADSDPLQTGIAEHAFDHLGDLNEQATAAAQSGANIIYSTGFGQMGYQGLGTPADLQRTSTATAAYLHRARSAGIRLAIGYICATSIVNLDTFDHNWTAQFRSQFSSPPANWLQQDRNGKPLPSWYGGNYRPACMNNPDWRTYEQFIVRQQLQAGFDGIFFDNPIVHPDGCYCPFCMQKFRRFLATQEQPTSLPAENDIPALRKLALDRPQDFKRFRATIAPDFLSQMRTFARTINPKALITCNNSLNTPNRFFTQIRDDGIDIHQLSAVEDLIVLEDMATQPRTTADGKAIEYGPIYTLLHAISHAKPIVATVLADSDYHTPPNLMRLAMAEAAAHDASYLAWPTWPENVRASMVTAVRPEADFLRQNAQLLNGATPARDVLLFIPYTRWTDTAQCQAVPIAQSLAAANIQFQAVDEEHLDESLATTPPILLVESPDVLNASEKKSIDQYQTRGGNLIFTRHPDWLAQLQKINNPTILVDNAPTVRAIVTHQPNQTIVHLLNLNIQKLSSFTDRVEPVSSLQLHIRCHATPRTVQALSPDDASTRGPIPFTTHPDHGDTIIDTTIPRLTISTILLIHTVPE